jgi:hypothetical protein
MSYQADRCSTGRSSSPCKGRLYSPDPIGRIIHSCRLPIRPFTEYVHRPLSQYTLIESVEQLTVRVGQLEEQADTSIHDQVTAAFNELAGDYRDLWREERAKRLGLEEKVQKLASEAAVAPGLSVAQTDEKKFVSGI